MLKTDENKNSTAKDMGMDSSSNGSRKSRRLDSSSNGSRKSRKHRSRSRDLMRSPSNNDSNGSVVEGSNDVDNVVPSSSRRAASRGKRSASRGRGRSASHPRKGRRSSRSLTGSHRHSSKSRQRRSSNDQNNNGSSSMKNHRAHSSRDILRVNRPMRPDLQLDDDNNNFRKRNSAQHNARRTQSMDMQHNNARRTQSMDMSNNNKSRSSGNQNRRSGGRRSRPNTSKRLSIDTSVRSIEERKPQSWPNEDCWSSDDDEHTSLTPQEIADARIKAQAGESPSQNSGKGKRPSHRASKPGAKSVDGSPSNNRRSGTKTTATRVAMDGSLYQSTDKHLDEDDDINSEEENATPSDRDIAKARIKARAAEARNSLSRSQNNGKEKRSSRASKPGARSIDGSSSDNRRSGKQMIATKLAIERSLQNSTTNGPRNSIRDYSDSEDENDTLTAREIAEARVKARAAEASPLSSSEQRKNQRNKSPPRSHRGASFRSSTSSSTVPKTTLRPASAARQNVPGAFTDLSGAGSGHITSSTELSSGNMRPTSSHKPEKEIQVLVEAVPLGSKHVREEGDEEAAVGYSQESPVQNAAVSRYAELNPNNNDLPTAQVHAKPVSNNKRNILLGLLIVAAIVIGFLAGGWGRSDGTSVVETSTEDEENPSSVPSTWPSSPPTLALSSGSPTKQEVELVFDPPKEEDCDAVRSGNPVEAQDSMIAKSLQLRLDVTMQTMEIPDTSIWFLPLLEAVNGYMVPALVGCSEKQVSTNLEFRYAVANANTAGELPDEACADSAEEGEICLRVAVTLELFLKGGVSLPNLFSLLLEVIDSDWGEEVRRRRLKKQTLAEKLALPNELVKRVKLVEIVGLDPTEIPSSEPSSQPSISPSESPSSAPTTSAPTTHPSAVPTMAPNAMPSTKKPTNIPSTMPTKRPTPLPSPGPTTSPTPGPSHSPSASPSAGPSVSPSSIPSLRPSSNPSDLPSVSPSVFPSGSPSLLPSGSPSMSPSWIPSMVPSVTPSYAPSGTPSKCDVCIGWEACSSSFDTTGMCNACLGSRACDGAASTISSDSCVGAGACNRVVIGSPIINSCNGESTCNSKFWASLGENSCNCDFCCTCLPHTAVIPANSCNTPGECCTSVGGMLPENVGTSSCVGEDVCTSQMGDVIGYNSCRGRYACEQQWLDIGNNSCNGDHSCRMANVDFRWPHIQTKGTIGNDSCNGSRACYSKQYGFSAGDNSCNGNDACMATWYQQQMYVGNNSCNCDNCCKCFSGPTHIPDNSCNKLAPDEASIDFANGAPGEYQYCCTAP